MDLLAALFWSSVALTGNKTDGDLTKREIEFWSSVALTGNKTWQGGKL